MSELLVSVASFVVALGVLITVHEYGHFLLARRLGVKVLRFSIGFGRPLWQRVGGADRTEYVIALIPLGGYVKMLDEREAEVPAQELHRAFNRQPVASRFAIVAAGPVFNLLFAILAYWLMFMLGVPGIKPIVGEVDADSVAAQGGVRAGDEIVAVDQTETSTWSAASFALIDRALEGEPVALQLRDPDGRGRTVQLPTASVRAEVGQKDLLVGLGMHPVRPVIEPVIGEVSGGGAAERAGLRAGDRVVSADGQPIGEWIDWVEYVRERPGVAIVLEIERDGVRKFLHITPAAVPGEQGEVGRIGASVEFSGEAPEHLRAVSRYSAPQALGSALDKTWEMSVLTLRMLGKMVVGQVSWENLSGPITIARYAGYSAHGGMASFLAFLAIVSISLAILNLLPIPVLDGGHLFFYLIEMVKGSPVSEQAQALGQRLGILILLMLMSLALYNDLMRLLD